MKFIQPKGKNRKRTTWSVSEQTKAIVKYYAQYTEYTEDEVVDIFLQNILLDVDFMKWIENKRYNKRILEQIQPIVVTARGDQKSYIYANFNPKYAQMALTILRTFYNYCLPYKSWDKQDLTPAQRIGLTDKVFTMKDIIYFR